MYMFEEQVVKQVADRAEVCKKIKADDVIKTVRSIFDYIKHFNSISEFDRFALDERPFEEITIPNEFSNFITPRSVKYSPGNRQSTDLLILSSAKKGYKFNLREWIDLQIRWRSYFKRDSQSDTISLASIKVDKSLADVIDHAAIVGEEDGKDVFLCHYIGNPYIPIPLDGAVASLFRIDYWTTNADIVIQDYLSTVVF